MTSEEAQEIAERWVVESQGPKFVVDRSRFPCFEDKRYFVFSWNAKQWLEEGDELACGLGYGPTFIDKRDGRIFTTGSSVRTLEAYIEEHKTRADRETFIRQRFPDYDMRREYRFFIEEIHDREALLAMLESFNLLYAIPEIETGTIWRVPEWYSRELLEKRLSEPLPIVFGWGGLAGSVDNIYQLLGAEGEHPVCEISIEDYHKQTRTYEPSKATPEDLEPEW